MAYLGRFGMVILVVVVVAAAVMGNVGNAAEICGITVDDLMTCKPALESPDSVPPLDCCKALQKVKPLTCLCQYQNYLPAFGIDKNVALRLPQRCSLPNSNSFHCPT